MPKTIAATPAVANAEVTHFADRNFLISGPLIIMIPAIMITMPKTKWLYISFFLI